MIQTIMLSGEQSHIDGYFYFKNVDEVINEFLEKNNVEYVDVKVLDQENCNVLLIYKDKE